MSDEERSEAWHSGDHITNRLRKAQRELMSLTQARVVGTRVAGIFSLFQAGGSFSGVCKFPSQFT